MLKISTGRLKTYVLILLIISSLILCGSLWFEDYHGFSAFFAKISDMTFSKLMNIGRDDIKSKYDKILVPTQIVVNDGEGGHWMLYPSQKEHDELWKITKPLLKELAATQKGLTFDPVEEAEWNSLVSKRTVIMSFNYLLDQDIISLLTDTDVREINEPVLNVNELIMTRLGEKQLLYTKRKINNKYLYQKYTLTKQEFTNDSMLEEIFADATKLKYKLENEAFPTRGNRVFIHLSEFSSESSSRDFRLKEVEFDPEITIDKEEKMNDLVESFFQRGDYAKFIKNDGTNIFIDEKNNTLKVYSDGLIEFELREDNVAVNEGLDFVGALRKAVTTTEKFGGMDSLYIADCGFQKGQYFFRLDYAVNGVPVVCNRQEQTPKMDSSVEVIVNKDSIKYKRFFAKPTMLESGYRLSSDYVKIMDEIITRLGVSEDKVEIEDIRLVYQYSGKSNQVRLPVWLVKFNVDGKENQMFVRAVGDRS